MDRSNLTIPQLKAELSELGIKFKSKDTKAILLSYFPEEPVKTAPAPALKYDSRQTTCLIAPGGVPNIEAFKTAPIGNLPYMFSRLDRPTARKIRKHLHQMGEIKRASIHSLPRKRAA